MECIIGGIILLILAFFFAFCFFWLIGPIVDGVHDKDHEKAFAGIMAMIGACVTFILLTHLGSSLLKKGTAEENATKKPKVELNRTVEYYRAVVDTVINTTTNDTTFVEHLEKINDLTYQKNID